MNKLEELVENLNDEHYQVMVNNCCEAYEKTQAIYTAIITMHPEISQLLSCLDGAYGERQRQMGIEHMRYTLYNI